MPMNRVGASSMRRKTPAANVAQFTGSYLDRTWTRRFVLGTLLQRYDPSAASVRSTGTASATAVSSPAPLSARAEADVDAAVLATQRQLCERWQLPAKPLDRLSEARIFRQLARYACGEGTLSDECLDELRAALSMMPGAPTPVESPAAVEALLAMVGYTVPGDNLRRVAYAGALHYSPQAEALMEPLLLPARQREGGDAFDAIRVHHRGPAYAIDSATTSEVDDAIGLEVDPETGETYFIVYVSDATVYCPFDSPLEQLTARALATTTYLPEGVFFMLPKPIVEAATLREDRPCRTLCVKFQIDERTSALKNYSVHVGWLEQLRRITYDQVEVLLPPQAPAAGEEQPSEAAISRHGEQPADARAQASQQQQQQPSWLSEKDVAALRTIHAAAQARFEARLQRAADNHTAVIRGSLPDPLIRVRGTRVLSLTDQITSTQAARLAVAELMIAANEVCSRVAQAERLPIPFRGTRPLSSDHEMARLYTEPDGVTRVSTLDSSHTFLAEGMQQSVRALGGVTRAMYFHLPMYHAGLDTSFYTHSTSPLRRYADMLVHHQLKVWLWRTHGGRASPACGASSTGMAIPEYVMATLCANISTRQEQSALLQDGSTRFWALVYMQQQLQQHPSKTYLCLVGETKHIVCAPEYPRRVPSATATLHALLPPLPSASPSSPPSAAGAETSSAPVFVSETYVPELQLTHRLFHSRRDVVVGAVVECRVTALQPTQDVLEMDVVEVKTSGDERLLRQLWLSGVVSQLDA